MASSFKDSKSIDVKSAKTSDEKLDSPHSREKSPPFPTDNPHYAHDLEYTREEESKVIRTLDLRLFPIVLLTTFVLNMDRTNNSNAISDNLPADLGFNINTVNLATIIYSVLFSVFCVTGAIIAKHVGPARWIPILMFSWGWVTLAHSLIKNRSGYLTVRAFIAITEGGVIPATLVYLGGFYKGTELATRLAWFWGIQTIASAVSGLMASGLLQLQGVAGLYGWKWLFIVDGIITLVASIFVLFYLPRDAAHTKGGLRGFKPWFSEREIQIAVTRVVRDDPSKEQYEQTVTWADVKDTLTDVGIWGHMLITAIGLTPTTPLQTYLPTVIKSFHFNVFVANALTAPPYVTECITTVLVIWHSDRVRERGLHGVFGASWHTVGWIILRTLPDKAPRGVKYLGAFITQSWPFTHPLNIAWMSENVGSVGKRTVSSGMIIGFANIYGTWASQIYRADDAPYFKRGNTICIAFEGTAIVLWITQKFYYRWRNARNAERYAALSQSEKVEEDLLAKVKGNRSLTYRFTT